MHQGKSALNTANSLLTLLSCLRLRIARTYLCGQPETFTLLLCNTIHNGMILNLVLNKTSAPEKRFDLMILNLVHPKQDCSLKSKDLCFGFMSNHVLLDSCRVMSIACDVSSKKTSSEKSDDSSQLHQLQGRIRDIH